MGNLREIIPAKYEQNAKLTKIKPREIRENDQSAKIKPLKYGNSPYAKIKPRQNESPQNLIPLR